MTTRLISPSSYLVRRLGTTLDASILQLCVTDKCALGSRRLFDAFNPPPQDTGLLGHVIEPYECGKGEGGWGERTPDELVQVVEMFYDNTAVVKGMGENDLGVTFAGCEGDPLYDERSRGVVREVVDGVKGRSRHGVPFYVRSSGLTLDPEDVRNGCLGELGVKRVEFFLFGGSPPSYKESCGALSSGEDGGRAFGRLCEVISSAAERGGLGIDVGIKRGDRMAGELARSLGATGVHEYPTMHSNISGETGC
ncbi:hypothetical protein TrCOL_g10742 [Triparma columacea]|uniref:Uncharacterized protein n=1 Tax=Triparma columacea TaxID=722753 RepID=A0A9W7G157_9STRA|nr:hypothetical protein TrCOL_g10742 [Triparma columacea]